MDNERKHMNRCPDCWTWENDWDEGQQQKYVIGWIPLSEVNFE